MKKRFSKKFISLMLAATMAVGMITVPTVTKADSSAGISQDEKIYLAHANDPFVASQMINNFGGATKASPYNTYADSENGTRGAYLAANPALCGAPFIHIYNEAGVDLTNTTGTFYVNLYWTGNAVAGDQLVLGFSSDNGVSDFSNDPQWPLDLKTALDAGSIQQGWNVIPLPVSTHLGATGKATNFRIYNANADETTGLACGAVYTVDKNDSSKKYYIVNAQDEIVNSTLSNANGSMGATYTNYDDETKGAYVCAGPTVNHAIPFLNIAYTTPVSLADTTGKVTFNIYHTATSEAAEDVVICRLTYNGVDTPVDYPVYVNTLDDGWNAITVDADKTKELKGVMVYASAMTGTTALAAGSVHMTKMSTVTTTKNYLAHANDPFFAGQMIHNFGGVTKAEPYSNYGDHTRGAYVAANPAATALPFIHVYHEDGIDLTQTTGVVYVNLYWTGTATAGQILVVGFSSSTSDKAFITDGAPQWPVQVSSLQQGWNTLEFPVSGRTDIDSTNVTSFRVYNGDATGATGLACGAVYAVDKSDASKKTYIVNAQDEIVNGTLSNANGSTSTIYSNYDDGTKGAYVCAGPTVNHAIPFLDIAYTTPISLADTTGKVTFNIYHTATSKAAEDVVICRLTYDGVATPIDTPVFVNTLDDGWNAITVDADKTKELKGVMVYASAMAGTTALAAGSVYTATVKDGISATIQPEITDSIAMKYTVTLDEKYWGYDVPSMTFAVNGGNESESVPGKTTGVKNQYTFTYSGVMPQDMADVITATMTIGTYTKTYTNSVLDYCKYILSQDATGNATMAAAQTMVADLVVYGETVQLYRNEQNQTTTPTNGLLTNKMTAVMGSDAWLTHKTQNNTTPEDPTNGERLSGDSQTLDYVWKSARLVLKDKVTIRCKFTATSMEGLTVKYQIGNGIEQEAVIESAGTGNTYFVFIDDLYAYQYGDIVTLKFYTGTDVTGKTLNYSVNTYLAAKMDNSTTALNNLLNAINNYGNAANAYVAVQQ